MTFLLPILAGFKSVGAFFFRHWKAALLVGAALGVYLYHQNLVNSLKKAEKQVVELKAEGRAAELVCEANISTLRKSIKEQNDATQALKESAEKANEEAGKEASRILKKPLAPVAPGDVDALNKWMQELQ